MNLGKRIAAAVIAAATAITALSVSAFAADVIGTNPTKLKDGKQVTAQIPYVEFSSNDTALDNGANYKDFSFTAPADGVLRITFDMSCDEIRLSCFSADTLQTLSVETRENKTGSWDNWNGIFKWNSAASVYSGIVTYKVTKGDYYIRLRRNANKSYGTYYGISGNGRLHIMAEMIKPDAPQDIQIVTKTDTTAKLQWREPEDGTSYDLRYKAGDGKWTTVTDIMDNNVTIKKLTGATKYAHPRGRPCWRLEQGGFLQDQRPQEREVRHPEGKHLHFRTYHMEVCEERYRLQGSVLHRPEELEDPDRYRRCGGYPGCFRQDLLLQGCR